MTPDAADRLRAHAVRLGLDPAAVLRQSDTTGRMEGLYIKVEQDGPKRSTASSGSAATSPHKSSPATATGTTGRSCQTCWRGGESWESRVESRESRVESRESRVGSRRRRQRPPAPAPAANSRLPTPNSQLPTPDSRLPTPDSRLPTPDSHAPRLDLPRLPAAAGLQPRSRRTCAALPRAGPRCAPACRTRRGTPRGDVLTHTGMVCERLTADADWRALPPADRRAVFAAAVLHDVAKPMVTKLEDGRLRSRGHAVGGMRVARRLLMEMDAPFACREMVAGLVRHHGLPAMLSDKPDPTRSLLTAAVTTRLDWLAVLARADAAGRICTLPDDSPARLALFRDCCDEHTCWSGFVPVRVGRQPSAILPHARHAAHAAGVRRDDVPGHAHGRPAGRRQGPLAVGSPRGSRRVARRPAGRHGRRSRRRSRPGRRGRQRAGQDVPAATSAVRVERHEHLADAAGRADRFVSSPTGHGCGSPTARRRRRSCASGTAAAPGRCRTASSTSCWTIWTCRTRRRRTRWTWVT